ncbi:hypothetical protein [Spiroplasma endosymbiont of Labia minor]|uniref:hypothetical protein n=1 Tax=Spiroplasma endosymbiont of Labia minor TaxID=3066305 RepID=UPI0030D291C8
MIKKVLSMLSLVSISTVSLSSIVSCSNEESLNLTDNDIQLIENISQKTNSLKLNDNDNINSIFQKSIESKRQDIFEEFKLETKYTENELLHKHAEFNNYKLWILFFSYDYDTKLVLHDEYGYLYNMELRGFDNSESISVNIKDYSMLISDTFEWKTDGENWDYVKSHIFISIGDVRQHLEFPTEDEKPYFSGILLKTSFE